MNQYRFIERPLERMGGLQLRPDFNRSCNTDRRGVADLQCQRRTFTLHSRYPGLNRVPPLEVELVSTRADNAGMPLPCPALNRFADLSVQVDQPQEVGRTARGLRRLIPILGGEAVGTGWHARVLPGGADFQLVVSDTLAELDARYVLETDAGDLIYVRNRAIRSGPPELMARLVRGEVVDPALIYFRCSPSFETVSPSLRWINERMFVGTGARHPDKVVMTFFELA